MRATTGGLRQSTEYALKADTAKPRPGGRGISRTWETGASAAQAREGADLAGRRSRDVHRLAVVAVDQGGVHSALSGVDLALHLARQRVRIDPDVEGDLADAGLGVEILELALGHGVELGRRVGGADRARVVRGADAVDVLGADLVDVL